MVLGEASPHAGGGDDGGATGGRAAGRRRPVVEIDRIRGRRRRRRGSAGRPKPSGLAEAGLLRDQGRFGKARTVLKQVEARLSDGGPAELATGVAHAEGPEDGRELEEAPLLAGQGP